MDVKPGGSANVWRVASLSDGPRKCPVIGWQAGALFASVLPPLFWQDHYACYCYYRYYGYYYCYTAATTTYQPACPPGLPGRNFDHGNMGPAEGTSGPQGRRG